ncbi:MULTISPECIES: transposase family protein [Amycolatopsis]|uniref:H repeat-associated protein N-terminal domain-containing protein n=1 Tax=Amycolatopsis bullii TaxID=941987 RepID=A0ABQ3KJ87_9PSEU|nr:transposase family protein [Amycolatopsis bullii]GHG28405.1 hypothetical protein GCM10017567_55050 [Amycolatopsis bullii]
MLTRLASTGLDQVADLREYLAQVPDPRSRCGVRHSLESVLMLAAAAVAAGASLSPRSRNGPRPPRARTIEALPAPDDLGFPASTQVFQLTRYRTDRATGIHETHTGYGITSLPAGTSPATIAGGRPMPGLSRQVTKPAETRCGGRVVHIGGAMGTRVR